MKKLIETIKNIWHIEDLRTRILITLAFIGFLIDSQERIAPFTLLEDSNS